MSIFKKAKVVMLPTNKKADYQISMKTGNNNGVKIGVIEIVNPLRIDKTNTYWTGQHLYIISDEEIKDGDYFIDSFGNIRKNNKNTVIIPSGDKKIISTTDTSFKKHIGFSNDETGISKNYEYIPRPSQSFIEKYVEAYNSGKPINEIEVEYEFIKPYKYLNEDEEIIEAYPTQLKINNKDNIINIK